MVKYHNISFSREEEFPVNRVTEPAQNRPLTMLINLLYKNGNFSRVYRTFDIVYTICWCLRVNVIYRE